VSKLAKKKPKKTKSLYDEKGRWVEERGRIKGAIRRSFRLSPQMKEVLKSARVELSPALKKDGTPGKRPRVRYECAHCKELFPQKRVQVDHDSTVTPLWKKDSDMTYDELVRGIFCEISNLQVLCSTPMAKNNGLPSCHQKKTNLEKFLRTKLFGQHPSNSDYNKRVEKSKKEFLVYQEEKEEKLKAKNKRKEERDAKLAQRLLKETDEKSKKTEDDA